MKINHPGQLEKTKPIQTQYKPNTNPIYAPVPQVIGIPRHAFPAHPRRGGEKEALKSLPLFPFDYLQTQIYNFTKSISRIVLKGV